MLACFLATLGFGNSQQQQPMTELLTGRWEMSKAAPSAVACPSGGHHIWRLTFDLQATGVADEGVDGPFLGEFCYVNGSHADLNNNMVCNSVLGMLDVDDGEIQMVERGKLNYKNPTIWSGRLYSKDKLKLWKSRIPATPGKGIAVGLFSFAKVAPQPTMRMPSWKSLNMGVELHSHDDDSHDDA